MARPAAPGKTEPKVRKQPNLIDRHVGLRVKMRRLMLGMSQTVLGNALGLTFQQVQKYEKGSNRIGASRIQHLANILKVPPSFFFEGAPDTADRPAHEFSEAPSPDYIADFLATSDGLALTRAFMLVKDAKLRRAIVGLVVQIEHNLR